MPRDGMIMMYYIECTGWQIYAWGCDGSQACDYNSTDFGEIDD